MFSFSLLTSLTSLWGGIKIKACRIAHFFQVLLDLRRYAGKFVELLVRNPAEMLLPYNKLLGVHLRIIHRHRQCQIILGIPMEAFVYERVDAMRIAVLRRPGAVVEAGRFHYERIVVLPMPDRVSVKPGVEPVFTLGDPHRQRAPVGPDFAP